MMQGLLASGGSFWMPEDASTTAGAVDAVFYFILWVSVFFFVLVVGLMFAFMILYRQRTPGQEARAQITHNTSLELLWSIIPTIIVVIMFWWGYRVFMDMREPPGDTFDVNVRAAQWSWEFSYPNGEVDGVLHVPVHRPVKLTMRSDDVLHSLYIPVFREKQDVVPGRYTRLWFEANQTGVFPLVCAEYCGTSHSNMYTTIEVHPAETFAEVLDLLNPLKSLSPEQYEEFKAGPDAFIDKYRDDPKIGKAVVKLKTPVMMGEELYRKRQCATCHTVNGAASQGPTWLDLFGSDVALVSGKTVKADENYLRESILNPKAEVVVGFDNIMPKVTVTDREVDMLIAYIKTIKK